MPCASSSRRYSSTVQSRFGAECRSDASGASRRITCAWQSTATIVLALVERGSPMLRPSAARDAVPLAFLSGVDREHIDRNGLALERDRAERFDGDPFA